MVRRGQLGNLPDGRPVLFDDNTTPTWTFLWAAGRNKGPDVQYNHVWTDSQNPTLYTALWNLCATPAVLAKTTDGQNHPEVRRALQYRAYHLYGAHPAGGQPPEVQGPLPASPGPSDLSGGHVESVVDVGGCDLQENRRQLLLIEVAGGLLPD